MNSYQRHDTLLKQRLGKLIAAGNMDELANALNQLTASAFRTAGRLLADELLPALDDQSYWTCFISVVPTHSKAYLITFAKAAVKLYKARRLSVNSEVLGRFALQATAIDKRKWVNTLLPVLETAEEVKRLILPLGIDTAAQAAPYLIKSDTPASLYVLFKLLKKDEHNQELIRECIAQLVKNGSKLSFNMASILAHYFDCQSVRAQFSLTIPPYMLSRLDQGEETFMKVLQS